ncbi:MAG: cation diffusion facilitator family transporter [Elusimicrobiota bacterium]
MSATQPTGLEHASGETAIRPLALAFAITFCIFLLEFGGGIWCGSLALVADAMHMAVDLVALALGLFAAWAAGRPADDKRTFGYHRVEVLAALGNGIGLWIIVGVLLHEAWGRFNAPRDVRVVEMIIIAVIGLAANLIAAALLFRHSHNNLNVKGVLLHVLSDALGSIGAIAAGIAMWAGGWMIADSLATVFICVVITFTSYKLIRESIHILLEGAPADVDIGALRRSLGSLEGVVEVHDLHLWSLCSGSASMSGHLVIEPGRDEQAVRLAGAELLRREFGLTHLTLQIERRGD